MNEISQDERRSPQDRLESQFAALREILAGALDRASGLRAQLQGHAPDSLVDPSALAALPILRKTDLAEQQRQAPPFGGFATSGAEGFDHVFMSPGPIYEPGRRGCDWWRLARFLRALDIGEGDMVQNCFAYHLTPAGMMFESAARAVGATVLPAGTGQTELQVQAAADIGVTAYAGTPDYLKAVSYTHLTLPTTSRV